MRLVIPIHSPPVHSVLLRACAWLVPAHRREEWLAEWKTELWYAWEACNIESHRPEDVTSFCLGAIRDALWLRRNAPLPRTYGMLLIETQRTIPTPPTGESRLLKSPSECLAFLGLLTTVCFAIAALLPTARNAIFPPLHPDARSIAMLAPYAGVHARTTLLLNLLTLFAVAWAIVPATTSLSLGDFPAHPQGFRRWAFFAAKIALLVPLVAFGALDLASLGPSLSPLGIHAALWGWVMALRWALLDQRRRCPVCLRLLAKPVRIGQASRMFLEWNGTELLCLSGHGLLHVPEQPAIWFSRPRWLHFDPSWRELF